MAYRIKDGELVSYAIKRISLDQIDIAIDHLEPGIRNKSRAVHEARVCFKKLRAVLRLIQGELGPDTFSKENREYRDAGRELSAARDTTVIAGTFEELAHTYNKQLEHQKFKSLRKHLRRSRAKIDQRQVSSDVVNKLTLARERVETWPLASDGFSALRVGLQRVYKRGRRCFELARAESTTENLHEWRKQVKYLLYQTNILSAMWPDPLDALGRELNKLSDYLSEIHDLALLKMSALEEGTQLEDASEIERLVALITSRCDQLKMKADSLGARVYAEKPKAFANRLQAYWSAWRPTEAVEPVRAEQMSLVYEATAAT
jgi:CHAD domain-containing protein